MGGQPENTDRQSPDPHYGPGLQTTYMYGPVHGLPLRTPSTDHPQNIIKIINKYFSYGLSNRLLVTVKFRMLRCANVTDLDSGSGAIYITKHCHFFCCGHKVYEKRVRGSLEICVLSLLPFCSAHSPVGKVR